MPVLPYFPDDASAPGMDPYALQFAFSHPPVLSTQRLILRPIRMRDCHDLFAYARDPEVSRFVLWDRHESLRYSRQFIRAIRAQYRHGEPSSLAIQLREPARVIGTVGFTSCAPEHACAEVGYSLAREYWNQGYATEALDRLIRYAVSELGFHRIEAMHDVENPASGRVMVKCGMHHEGRLRDRIWNKGRFHDVELYALIRPEP